MSQVELINDLAEFAYDPYGFVLWAFPWGQGELEGFEGPDVWQTRMLKKMGEELDDPARVIRFAMASGHGVGKSAFVAWITLWAFSTFPGTRGIITANTEVQLKTRTWVEMAKWYNLFLGKELLTLTATALFAKKLKGIDKEWRIDFVPWNEKNPSAFQGMHNKGRRLLMIFDEAAEIPHVIWEAVDGAMTDKDTEIFWFVFGNPTIPEGRFRECFEGGRFEHRWHHTHVNGLESNVTNKELLKTYLDDWGDDSDYVRVRVLGKFPRSVGSTFISYEMALEAANREIPAGQDSYPVILGVDVARFGDDYSVIYPRQGLDARSRPPQVYLGASTEQLANHVAIAFRRYGASVAMVDGTGVGGGVVDKLRERFRIPVVEVQFGSKPQGFDLEDPSAKYANKKTEIYGLGRHWIKRGAIVRKVHGYDRELPKELSSVMYQFRQTDDAMQLVPKSLTKKEHGSPDVADALMCTFAQPWVEGVPEVTWGPPAKTKDYNPFDEDLIYA